MSNEDKRYNGWTNYETWCVALWLDNEKGSHNEVREMTKQAWDDARPSKYRTRQKAAECELANALKDMHAEANPLDDNPSVFSDLLGAALSEVNWYEIAEGYLETFGPSEDEEDDSDDETDDDSADETE